MRRVAVIDYGMGNLRSVSKALETVSGQSAHVFISSQPEEILSASHIVFPGVGAIRDCMDELQRLRLDDVVREAARSKPFIGICLGMQAMLSRSEENNGITALDIIPGEVKAFDKPRSAQGDKLKVPHMGWNQVHQTCTHPLWQNIAQDSRFYFVHGYYVSPTDPAVVAATTHYGNSFASAIYRDNVFATQFHPEKSQRAGLQLLENFVNWDGQS
jgi:glutamine amidotransferase